MPFESKESDVLLLGALPESESRGSDVPPDGEYHLETLTDHSPPLKGFFYARRKDNFLEYYVVPPTAKKTVTTLKQFENATDRQERARQERERIKASLKKINQPSPTEGALNTLLLPPKEELVYVQTVKDQIRKEDFIALAKSNGVGHSAIKQITADLEAIFSDCVIDWMGPDEDIQDSDAGHLRLYRERGKLYYYVSKKKYEIVGLKKEHYDYIMRSFEPGVTSSLEDLALKALLDIYFISKLEPYFPAILEITAKRKHTAKDNFLNPLSIDHTKGKDFPCSTPSERNRAYYKAWVTNYESQYAGGIAGSIVVQGKISEVSANHTQTDAAIYQETQYASVAANASGLAIGQAVSSVFPYETVKSNNPFYRIYDAFATFGWALGDALSFFFLPFVPHGAQSLVSVFLGGIFSFSFGLLTFPFLFFQNRHKKLKEEEQKNKYGLFFMSSAERPLENSSPTHLRLYQENGRIFYYFNGEKHFISGLKDETNQVIVDWFQDERFLTAKKEKDKEKNLLHLTITKEQRKACRALLYATFQKGHIQKFLNEDEVDYCVTGVQGFAYYTKTGQQLGSNMGVMVGARTGTPRMIYQDAALGALGGFAVSLFGVPLINAITSGKLIDQHYFEMISYERYLYFKNEYKANTYLLINRGFWELIYVDLQLKHKKIPIHKVKRLADLLQAYEGEVDQLYENEIEKNTEGPGPATEPLTDSDELVLQLKEENERALKELIEDQTIRREKYIEDKRAVAATISDYHYSVSMDRFRHNYIRTGIIIGVLLGQIIGYAASFFIPGANLLVDMLACSGGFGIAGGIYYGVRGQQISKEEHSGPCGHCRKRIVDGHCPGCGREFEIEYTDNSWDYNNREGAEIGGYIGGLIGFYLPVPLGPFIGMAVGSAIGWYLGCYVTRAARAVEPNEDPSKTLSSWTIRVPVEAKKGCVAGALIGLTIGLLGGPFGALTGVVVGFYIGGIVGWLYGVMSDEKSRIVLKKSVVALWGSISEGCHKIGNYVTALWPSPGPPLELSTPSGPSPFIQGSPTTITQSLSTASISATSSSSENSRSQKSTLSFEEVEGPSLPEGPSPDKTTPPSSPSPSHFSRPGPTLFGGPSEEGGKNEQFTFGPTTKEGPSQNAMQPPSTP